MGINTSYGSSKNLKDDNDYVNVDSGPYEGFVKKNDDPTKMGRLGVYIPAIHGADNVSEENLVFCQYLSPFYGIKTNKNLQANAFSYNYSQHSYGMWTTPPDIDTRVLVIFAEGKITKAFWIGCIQEPYQNNMVPDFPKGITPFYQKNNEREEITRDIFNTDFTPSGNFNRETITSGDAQRLDGAFVFKPTHPHAENLREQGLIKDDTRGLTTSSARRETPSNVFGISTPGPIDQRSTHRAQVGPKNSEEIKNISRGVGHVFVMDDGDAKNENQLIRLRTSSGHQLLMNDSKGVVYLANGEGTVWMEFSNNGMVDVYAQTGYNIRSGGDVNFHAEGNINMYANKSVKIKANQDDGQVSIDGSEIKGLATNDVNLQGQNVYTKAKTNILAEAGQRNIQQGATRVDLTGGQVHFNSFPVISNLVTPLVRTSFLSPSGTGTAINHHPDVSLKPVNGFFQVDRALQGMTGMRVPTHEPYWQHDDFVLPYRKTFDKKTGLGTPEAQRQRNRNSQLMSVRWSQYKADLDAELAKEPNKTKYSVTQKFNSTKADNFLTAGVKDYKVLDNKLMEFYNTITDTLKVSDKDNINVASNQEGVVFVTGENETANITTTNKTTGNLNAKAISTNRVSSLLQGETSVVTAEGNLSGRGSAPKLNNVSQITETYKSVVGGEIVAVTEVKSAVSTTGKVTQKISSVAKRIGKIFGF